MNFNLVLTILFYFLTNAIAYFVPSIAFHPGLPFMYLTLKGWVRNENQSISMQDVNAAVKICKAIYPNENITKAIKIFNKVTIDNWCKNNQTCLKTNTKTVYPIHCASSSYKNPSFVLHNSCLLKYDKNSACQSFEYSRSKAAKVCKNQNYYLFNFQVTFDKFTCTNETMKFMKFSFICCPYKVSPFGRNFSLEDYLTNDEIYKEHELFSVLKHTLFASYKNKMNFWKEELQTKMYEIVYENSNGNIDEKMIENIKQIFKIKYFQVIEEFTNQYLKIGKIHIDRIVNKTSNACSKAMSEYLQTDCVILLNKVVVQLKNQYNHLYKTIGIDIIGYRDYVAAELRNLIMKYANLTNQHHGKNFALLRNYNSAMSYLISKGHRPSYEKLFESDFDKLKRKAYQYHNSPQNQNGNSVMSVVVTTFILLILIVLTLLAILVIKYCGQPLRRSSPNYVMSVVFNTNQTPESTQKLNHQTSNIPNKQGLKLNLYENPLFNSKSSTNPIEKQSLIENMES